SENITVMGEANTKDLLAAVNAAGFVTDDGGRLCNFGVLAREMKIPVLSATQNGTSVLRDGESVHLVTEQGKVLAVQEAVPESPVETLTPSMDGTAPMPQPDFPQVQPELPFEEPPPSYPDVGSGSVKIFAKTGPEMVGRIQGAEGYIVYQIQADPTMLTGTQPSGAAMNVWAAYNGNHDFHATLELTKRLIETGGDTGLLMPIVRGREDVERVQYQIPPGSKTGINIKTPAMALSLDSVLGGSIDFVNIDLVSLSQLSMGLKDPGGELHPAVADVIGGIRDKCRNAGIPCCVTVGSAHVSEQNIEMLIKKGIDVICIEPAIMDEVRSMISNVESRMKTEASGFSQPEQPASGNQKPEMPFDDFSPASFS
ncbi:MAG: hypothetical protein JSV63_02555, partial [Candidatus Aenigmatarchaeota archaeon]